MALPSVVGESFKEHRSAPLAPFFDVCECLPCFFNSAPLQQSTHSHTLSHSLLSSPSHYNTHSLTHSASPHLLSMSFVLKAEYQGDIRRAKITTAYSFAEFVSLVHSSWLISVPALTYQDTDGDTINIVTGSDWRAALDYGASGGVLRIKGTWCCFPCESRLA
jgi:hypothetical protein